ncbi:hypothetical protein QZH41_011418 [Actinostola sp. cb2023]|nr:hypothetical protein QZH41_011418 [Actinostola sp. cb2023]
MALVIVIVKVKTQSGLADVRVFHIHPGLTKMMSMSYYHKPRTNPLDNRTLHQILDDNAAKHPDKESIVFYDANQHRSFLTFQQLKDQSIKFAASLLKLGFKRGDRVLLYAPNSLEFVVCWMAMNRLGICAVLKYITDNEWESYELLKRLSCDALICGLNVPDAQRERIISEIMEIAQQKNEEGKAHVKVIITIRNAEENVKHPKVLKYENLMNEMIDQAEVIAAQSKVDPEDLAFVCFTSGSTGSLKAVTYTHHAVVNAFQLMGNGISRSDISRSFMRNPMAWSSGAMSIVSDLISGSTYVTTVYSKVNMNDSFKFMFDIIQTEKCTRSGIPQQHVPQLLLEKFQENYDLSSFSGWGFSGQIVHRRTIQSLLEAIPHTRAVLFYATSEVRIVAIQPLNLDSVTNKDDYGKMYILPDIEVKIVDDEGLVVPLGTKGEICVRGPKMFLEYLEDPEGTSKAKKPTGWVHTSDYGIMYDRARIKVLGRRTDLIDTKIQAVFPVEVEEILLEHPDIQDVVAVGVPIKDEKEDICAFVIQVPESSLETRVNELQKWCEQVFSVNNHHLNPRYIIFLKAFPVSKAGKIDRRAVKRLAQEL